MTGTRLLSEKLKIIVYKSLNIVYKNMCLLEDSLRQEDIEFVICLLRNNPRLMNDELSDGTTCKDKLIELNKFHYVLSQIN